MPSLWTYFIEALEGAAFGDALGPWCLRSDLGPGGDQLPTTRFQVRDLPGRLLVQPDSEGCDPNPTLRVAEMIKVVTVRLPQGAGGNGGCREMSRGRNQGLEACPYLQIGLAHPPCQGCRMNHLGSAPLSCAFLGNTYFCFWHIEIFQPGGNPLSFYFFNPHRRYVY